VKELVGFLVGAVDDQDFNESGGRVDKVRQSERSISPVPSPVKYIMPFKPSVLVDHLGSIHDVVATHPAFNEPSNVHSK
jgi:hypothetical protein